MTDLQIAMRLEALKTEKSKLETKTATRLAEIKSERFKEISLRGVGVSTHLK